MIKLKDILNELIAGNRIQCGNCDWNWKIVDGGADLYVCHKCGHDNTPTLKEQTSKITDLFIGQARPEYNSDSILQNISTAAEKGASALFTKLLVSKVLVLYLPPMTLSPLKFFSHSKSGNDLEWNVIISKNPFCAGDKLNCSSLLAVG